MVRTQIDLSRKWRRCIRSGRQCWRSWPLEVAEPARSCRVSQGSCSSSAKNCRRRMARKCSSDRLGRTCCCRGVGARHQGAGGPAQRQEAAQDLGCERRSQGRGTQGRDPTIKEVHHSRGPSGMTRILLHHTRWSGTEWSSGARACGCSTAPPAPPLFIGWRGGAERRQAKLTGAGDRKC